MLTPLTKAIRGCYGAWLPLSVRYDAARAAYKVITDWENERLSEITDEDIQNARRELRILQQELEDENLTGSAHRHVQ